MRRVQPLPGPLLTLASRRHGVVTTRDLRAAGVSNARQSRRVADGTLTPLYHGVFAVARLADPFSPLVAVQAIYPDLVAEGRTAATVFALDGFPASALGLTSLELVRPRALRVRTQGMPRARVAELPGAALTVCLGIRVTTPIWTLSALGQRALVADDLELAVESALRKALTTESALRAVQAGPALREVLARRSVGSPPTESYAETRFLQTVVRPLELENPERQAPIHVRGRPAPYRCDFLFRRRRPLDVEIDGESHGDAVARDHDAVRDHLIRATGCEVVRFAAWRVDRAVSATRTALLQELEAVS